MTAFRYPKKRQNCKYICNLHKTCSIAWKCSHSSPHEKSFIPHEFGNIPSNCKNSQAICEKILDV